MIVPRQNAVNAALPSSWPLTIGIITFPDVRADSRDKCSINVARHEARIRPLTSDGFTPMRATLDAWRGHYEELVNNRIQIKNSRTPEADTKRGGI
jgi:hypothetical protein